MTSFLVVGEALVDVLARAGHEPSEHAGGSPANVAFGLAKLGNDVSLLTCLGDDARGAMIRDRLSGAGVEVVISPSDRPTSSATAVIADDGSAAYDFDISWDVDISLAPTADVLHVGSIAATMQPGADEIRHLVTARRPSSVISFDPNIRPALLGSRVEALRRVEHLVVLSDIVKVSDDDLAWLYPSSSPILSATRWATNGGPLIVVTAAAAGATAFWHGARVDVPARAATVIDTVGAGDSFTAGLLDALGRTAPQLDRESLLDLDQSVITEALAWAAATASVTVSRAGADLPSRDEVPTDRQT